MITENKIMSINKKSFLTVVLILSVIMIFVYILTFFIPKGYYPTNEEIENGAEITDFISSNEISGLPFWKFLLAPILVLFSPNGLTLIVISLFILILAGSFNVIDKTGGIKSIIQFLIEKFKKRKYLLLYLIILFFMLFGSLFGIFEESVTLLPIIIMLSLALGWDTFTGLIMCLLASGFGFSSAITNPFSVGLACANPAISPVTITTNIWYRIIIFIIMYIILCIFATIHVKSIEKNPVSSPTYESDQLKKQTLNFEDTPNDKKTLSVYSVFFITLLLVIIVSSIIPAIQKLGISIIIIAVSFLLGTFICNMIIKKSLKETMKHFISGLTGMLPALVMIFLAGSIKYILDEAGIMGTIIHEIISLLSGHSPIVGVLLIYLSILIIQFFIGSASAKVILIVPMIAIISTQLGISKNLSLLAFIFGDGYTDLIYPTNPVLLIALGMSSFNYLKWIKKTWLLQTIVLTITVLLLILGFYIGY